MSSIGDKIKQLRNSQGKTLEDVANMVGVSRQTIQRYESGVISNIPYDKIERIAKALNVQPDFLMGWTGMNNVLSGIPRKNDVKILGRIVAGVPLDAVQEDLGTVDYCDSLTDAYSYFALIVSGESMAPRIMDGDTVIVRQQPTVDDGEIAVVMVNGNDATVKQVRISKQGITLVGFNTAVYQPHFYTNDDIRNLPVEILGRVMESRAKF